ncbi:hypothetical protein F511_35839 [Dorcoceras hygrometricum]|uniref:Uncharacterized protein n=1 Tax=Dorcoceras hygrometricum TaxID=472368 RepID=A0A2Z7CML5_9LAMI|nr:hypothetical protein F511_35839 [Dorcoceras hygrometricum]
MSLFDLQDVCIAIRSIATLDLPMVVDLIGIYVLKGPYCTLTMTNWFLQALSVIPKGSWGDVARRFTMIRWGAVVLTTVLAVARNVRALRTVACDATHCSVWRPRAQRAGDGHCSCALQQCRWPSTVRDNARRLPLTCTRYARRWPPSCARVARDGTRSVRPFAARCAGGCAPPCGDPEAVLRHCF